MLCGSKNETDNNQEIYRISPKEGWKVAIFNSGASVKVNEEEYWFSSFINSDNFIIHEVVSMIQMDYGNGELYSHVWYEDKK